MRIKWKKRQWRSSEEEYLCLLWDISSDEVSWQKGTLLDLDHWSPLLYHHGSSWIFPAITSHHCIRVHRSLYNFHYLSFGFSVSWLGTLVVASPNEWSQLDEGGQLTGHLFSFNHNHLIRLCIFLNYKDVTEERVIHLPASRMFVLWCILVPPLLHARISAVACMYLLYCMLSTPRGVACLLCAGTL